MNIEKDYREEDFYQVQKIHIPNGGFREICVDFRNEINEQVDVVLLTLPQVVHQANVETVFGVDLFTEIWRKKDNNVAYRTLTMNALITNRLS